MKHTILIPTYNKCDELLKPCLQSIIRYTDMSDVEVVISANGCKDNTREYIEQIIKSFGALGMEHHIKLVWNDAPLGYAGAVNAGLKVATGRYITLLNNDVQLLEQHQNHWLDMLEAQFDLDQNCGISCVVKGHSIEVDSDFAIFFCAMIRRDVFYNIGNLDEIFEIGGCEDIDFCYRAKQVGFTIREAAEVRLDDIAGFAGGVPIFHAGESTMNDSNLVNGYKEQFDKNLLKLTKKHNPKYYRFLLSNNYERAVFLKGDDVFPREQNRYLWAKQLIHGKIIEVGCSTGYGSQFLGYVDYLGVDYDPVIVDVANQQKWGNDIKFENADIRKFDFSSHNAHTIIAFEVIEHLDDGLEIVELLKKSCKRLIISVPFNEPQGFWGEHHKLHGLNESHFPGFEFRFMNEFGDIGRFPKPASESRFNLMLGVWDAP